MEMLCQSNCSFFKTEMNGKHMKVLDSQSGCFFWNLSLDSAVRRVRCPRSKVDGGAVPCRCAVFFTSSHCQGRLLERAQSHVHSGPDATGVGFDSWPPKSRVQ